MPGIAIIYTDLVVDHIPSALFVPQKSNGILGQLERKRHINIWEADTACSEIGIYDMVKTIDVIGPYFVTSEQIRTADLVDNVSSCI